MKLWLRGIGLVLLVIVGIAAIAWWWSDGESTNDAYVVGHVHPLAPRVGGSVASVLAQDNQHVHAGDVLVTLDPADFRVREQLARAQIAQAQAQIAAATAQKEQARASIASTAATLHRSRLDLTRAEELIGESPRGISRQEYDAAKATRDSADAAAQAAQAQLAAADAAESAAQAQVATGQANLEDALLAIGYTRIVAPVDGYVGRKTVEVGARVNIGQTLLAIVADDVWVVANYKETQLRGIRSGAPADIRVDALPGVRFKAKVDSFSPASGAQFSLLPPDNATGNFTKVVQRIPVKLLFDPVQLAQYRAQLMPGLSVVARVEPAAGAKSPSP